MDRPALWRLLIDVATHGPAEAALDPAASPARHLLPLPDCLPHSRLRKVALSGRGTPQEEVHLEQCDWCRSACARIRQRAAHPTPAELYRAVANPTVAVRAHLEQDCCRRCLLLSTMFSTTSRLLDRFVDLKGVLERLTAAAAPLSLAPASAGFSTRDSAAQQPVRFIGVDAWAAVLRLPKGPPVLELEMAATGADPRLFYLIVGVQSDLLLERLVLMSRPGFSGRTRLARVPLPAELTIDVVPLLTEISLTELGAPEARLLTTSCTEASRADPAAGQAWRDWAAQTKRRTLDPAVVAALDEIAATV
jgi:hypothetical protein